MDQSKHSQIGIEAELDAPVTALHWCEDRAAVALGDGSVFFCDSTLTDHSRTFVHDGAILTAVPTPDRRGLITGGDDGKVRRILPSGEPETVNDIDRGWVEHVASVSWGAIAWTEERAAVCLTAGGKLLRLDLPSSCGGLAFAPNGYLLAVAHYGGVTLWPSSSEGQKCSSLSGNGSYVGVVWSPDGRFLLGLMQDNMLHGWRLRDETNMLMGGYLAKPRSLSWSTDGTHLATSGSPGAVIWPFDGEGGPLGRQAREVAQENSLVRAVAFHPKRDLLAVGYSSGLISLLRVADGKMVLLRSGEEGAIDHLVWSPGGKYLAYASLMGFFGIMQTESLIHERFQ